MESQNSETSMSHTQIQASLPNISGLFLEFSRRSLTSEFEDRKTEFMNADESRKKCLVEVAESEVHRFHDWLIVDKNVDELSAHYLAIGLKSALTGLPFGLRIAQLFETLVKRL